MDPNFFHVDLQQMFELFLALVLLSMFLERGLALLFEHEWYIKTLGNKGLKPVIALGVALFLCRYWHFDAVSVVVLTEHTSWPGYIITAGVIAGGSKASIKLFHDFLGVKSTAEKARQQKKMVPSTSQDSQPLK